MTGPGQQTATITIYQGDEKAMVFDGGAVIDGLFHAAHHLSTTDLRALIERLQAAESEINTRFR